MTPSLAVRLRRLSEEAAALADELEAGAELAEPPIGDDVPGNWLTIADVARLLGVTKNAIRKRIKLRGIETGARGARVLIFSDDLAKLYSRRPAHLATPAAHLATLCAASHAPILCTSNGRPSPSRNKKGDTKCSG